MIPKWVVNTLGIAFGDFWVVRVGRFRPPQFSEAGERWDGQQPLASPSLLHDKVDFKSCAACTLFDFWSVSISDCSLYCAVFGNNWFLGAIFIVFIFESCVGVC